MAKYNNTKQVIPKGEIISDKLSDNTSNYYLSTEFMSKFKPGADGDGLENELAELGGFVVNEHFISINEHILIVNS